ncbi:MAG TPA: trypsin-like peptidase domain-containing protein, partial [Prolixibacteraceae bacterium]|nr:trypsin-like peptidase domain-containing protein [Prolixibacteraceae bacterium]
MTGVQKICIVGIISGILLAWVPLSAQVQTTGVPESFKLTEKSAIIIPSATLDSVYPQKMISEDKLLGIQNRYGVVEPTVIDIKKESVATKIENKGTIWRYQFDSPDAYSLGINFQSFHIPEKASLFIYNPEKGKVAGAFTSINNKESKLFTLADFIGGSVILEYFEPDSAEYSGEVIIGSVTLAYRAQTTAATSRIGVNCPTGDDWQVEKNSVCRMTFNDGRYAYLCSGALINNVREDGTPYFLTANHCLSTSSEASTLVTYFNYENSTCSSNDASLNHSLSGATLKATLAGSDFTLLLLDENPLSAYKPYFAGWDASGDNPESGVCIHHPEGTPKCISVDQDKIYDNTTLISWDNHTYSALHSHWDVQFDVGNIEEGSSGGPLFDQNKRIVGQLHGGSDTDNFYGKLSVSWASSTTATKQLKAWLDPDGTGVKTLDGMGTNVSPKAKFTTQITKACTNNPVQLTDKSLYSPKKWLWRITPSSYQFVNQTDSTTRNPVVEFLSENSYTIKLIASNDYGSDSALATNYIDARNQLDVKFQS